MVLVATTQGTIIDLQTPEDVAGAIDAGLIDTQTGGQAQIAIAGGPANSIENNPGVGSGTAAFRRPGPTGGAARGAGGGGRPPLSDQADQDAAIALLSGGGRNINSQITANPSLLDAEGNVNDRGQSFLTGFLRRRGVGQGGIGLGTAAGRFISSQFNPLASLFRSQGVIGAASNQGQGEFADFTPGLQTRSQRSGVGSTVLQDFFNLTPEQRANAGLTFERAFDQENQPISGTGDEELSFLQNLLGQGTRGTRGAIGSNFIRQRLPFVRQQFELNQPGGSFIDFVRNRFGL